VALVERGRCSFYQKVRQAQLAGAIAVVIFSQDADPVDMGCSAPDPCSKLLDISVVMVSQKQGEAMLAAMFPPGANASGAQLVASLSGELRGPGIVGLLAPGSLWAPGSSALGVGLEQEILGMEYQRGLAVRRAELEDQVAKGADLAFRHNVFRRQRLHGSLTASWSMESAARVRQAGYDTLEIELHLDCDRHRDENCAAWDQEMSLFLCTDDQASSGSTRCRDSHAMVARWITPYGREGRWLSDASPALPLLISSASSGRPATFHLQSPQSHLVTMVFWLRRSTSDAARSRGKSVARVNLWEGGRFDEEYNSNHPALQFQVPPTATQAILSILLTGHGWGVDEANCAEFCDHHHIFRINGAEELIKAHPLASSLDGCSAQILDGVVPNQYGTWPFGRAGWCPGWPVRWWEVDVTPWLLSNASVANTITYDASYNGTEYVPVPARNGNSQGFPAEIHLSSFLNFYASPALRRLAAPPPQPQPPPPTTATNNNNNNNNINNNNKAQRSTDPILLL
ncbi:unnamed protein product, partial [Polarella glacialis]